jgi:hypothetical protein
MSHGSNVFDGAIGHQQAMLGGKLAPLDRGAVDDLPQTHPVVRMGSVKHQLNGRLYRRLEFEYPISLIGPVDFPARRVPAETPAVAQSLRLRQIHLTPAKRLFGLLAVGAVAGFAQRALHGGHEPRQSRLHNIIRGSDFNRLDRHFFAERPGNEDERQIGAGLDRKLQCGKAVEGRKFVIRENEVDSGDLKTGDELGAGLNAGYFTDEMIGLKELLNELRVMGVILQQQNPKRRCHFFTLPGGGSLMTAQKTPSSFTALTNS